MRVLALDAGASWDPTELLAPRAEQLWPGMPLTPVQDIAEPVLQARPSRPDQPVVTPGAVDASTGAVTRTRRDYAGSVRQLGAAPGDLHPGDVLVPIVATKPALLLGAEHEGLAFSEGFLALRAAEHESAVWLWGVLTSSSGGTARLAASRGGAAPRLTISALLKMSVPQPHAGTNKIDELRQFVLSVPGPSSQSDIASSWWRTTALASNGDWNTQLVLRDPRVLEEGTPLGALAAIAAGRRPQLTFQSPRPGLLPVRQGRTVDGKRIEQWAEPEAAPAAQPGDVLVVEIGARGRASVVDDRCLVGPGLLRLRLRNPDLAEVISSYLNSEAAQTLRSSLTVGAVIPRLTATSLARIPVPETALELDMALAPQPIEPRILADRVEQALWA